MLEYCYSYNNSCTGIVLNVGQASFCISANNTGGTSDGFQIEVNNRGAPTMDHCTSYGNGRSALYVLSGTQMVIARNSVFQGANASDVISGSGATFLFMSNSAIYAASTGAQYTGSIVPAGYLSFITLTADPFTNAASGDFSLNHTVGGGLACRRAGFPGVFPGGTTTGYSDIGAVQNTFGRAAPGLINVGGK